ncbi:MAG: hypothetical protein QOJ81_543 [Chloroflexota bacterium]|nr:hypothetical protein [Chloroflexota bacterium]
MGMRTDTERKPVTEREGYRKHSIGAHTRRHSTLQARDLALADARPVGDAALAETSLPAADPKPLTDLDRFRSGSLVAPRTIPAVLVVDLIGHGSD